MADIFDDDFGWGSVGSDLFSDEIESQQPQQWNNWWWGGWDMFWDIQWSWWDDWLSSDMFWWEDVWWFVSATKRQAYQHAVSGEEKWEFKKKNQSFTAMIAEFVGINSEIYKWLNATTYATLFILLLLMWLSTYFLQNFIIYFVTYNYTWITNTFAGLEQLIIVIVYGLILYYFFDFLDWESKMLKAILNPIKLLMIWLSTLYLGNMITFSWLFTMGIVFVFLGALIKVFSVNELEKAILDQKKNALGIENEDVKNDVKQMIEENQGNYLHDMPQVWDILLSEEDEEEQYNLFIEIMSTVKDKKYSGVLVSPKSIYYVNQKKVGLPQL